MLETESRSLIKVRYHCLDWVIPVRYVSVNAQRGKLTSGFFFFFNISNFFHVYSRTMDALLTMNPCYNVFGQFMSFLTQFKDLGPHVICERSALS